MFRLNVSNAVVRIRWAQYCLFEFQKFASEMWPEQCLCCSVGDPDDENFKVYVFRYGLILREGKNVSGPYSGRWKTGKFHLENAVSNQTKPAYTFHGVTRIL